MQQLGSFSVYITLIVIIFILLFVCILNTVLFYNDYNSDDPQLSESNSQYLIGFNILLAILFFIIFIMLIYMSRTNIENYDKRIKLEKEMNEIMEHYNRLPVLPQLDDKMCELPNYQPYIIQINELNNRIAKLKSKPNSKELQKEIDDLKSINNEMLQKLIHITDEKKKETEELKKKLIQIAEEHKEIISDLRKELEHPVEPIKDIKDIERIEEKLILPTNISPPHSIEKNKDIEKIEKKLILSTDTSPLHSIERNKVVNKIEESDSSDSEPEDNSNNRFRSFLNNFKKIK